MKQTVLSDTPENTKRKLTRLTFLCTLLAFLTLGTNILLALRFTEKTRLPFLLTDIASDIAVFCGIICLLDRHKPQRILLRLTEQKGAVLDCRVEQISDTTLRYLDLDCYEVKADSRTLFLPCGTLKLQAGKTYRLRTASNVITEAEG